VIQQREPQFKLVPEWNERLPEGELNGRIHINTDGRRYRRRVPISYCERCGIKRQENSNRRHVRLAAGLPFICADCRLSDPEYVTMVTPTPEEVACPA